MATHTLTKASPSQEFTMANDGDVQVIISNECSFNGNAYFQLELESEVATVFLPILETRTSHPYAKIFTFKAGKLKLVANNFGDEDSLIVDIQL